MPQLQEREDQADEEEENLSESVTDLEFQTNRPATKQATSVRRTKRKNRKRTKAKKNQEINDLLSKAEKENAKMARYFACLVVWKTLTVRQGDGGQNPIV